jgi:hypothetical protein
VNRVCNSILSLCFAIALAVAAFAQTPPAAGTSQRDSKRRFAAMIEKTSAPTEHHKALAPFIGEFDQVSEVRMQSGDTMKSHAVGTGRWIMGQRYVEVRSISAPDEELKGERLLIYGYDPAARKYTLCNFDSGSLAATTATGEYDASSRTFTFDGERGRPGAGTISFRWVLKVGSGGVIDQQILVKAGDKGFTEAVSVKHTPRAK